MKILSTLILALAFTGIARASNTPDLSDLHFKTGDGHGKMAECMKAGWEAAKPTDAQNASLGQLMTALHSTIDTNKDQIATAMRELFLTWGHHPVNKDMVHTSQSTLDQAIYPVKMAIMDAMADTINLLTIEQRGMYDQAFGACMHGH